MRCKTMSQHMWRGAYLIRYTPKVRFYQTIYKCWIGFIALIGDQQEGMYRRTWPVLTLRHIMLKSGSKRWYYGNKAFFVAFA